MITTDFVPGSPCWIDLGASDVAAAAGFYGAVFGWESQPFVPAVDGEFADYQVLRLDGRAVGGIGRLTEARARSAWMIYFNTADADATTHAVQRAGGTVRTAPSDAGDQGRVAQLSDPLGAQFAIWQPGKTQGLEVADEPGALCWTELYTTNASAAKEFYGNLFGWTTQEVPLPNGGGTYSIVTPSGGDEHRMHGGVMQVAAEHLVLTGGRPYWHPVFAVADCDAAAEAVTGNGGSVQMGPEDAGGVGRLAVCVDPAGADFVILTPPSDD